MFISVIFGVFGLGLLCWVLFTLAVYALPFFVGMTAGLAAVHSGAGVIGAIVVGIIAGAATLVAGQMAFATMKSPLIRSAIALLFAVPATVAGYSATLGLTHLVMASGIGRAAFAVIGAVIVGGTAFARMTLLAEQLKVPSSLLNGRIAEVTPPVAGRGLGGK